jgi:U3 small nucleolar RNA-associated protein 23
MRHLYASASEPGISYVIDRAKLFERRRCDHRPEEYPEPLSAVQCISSVVDPKGSKINKHRYVVASQHLDVRKVMREVMGVPLVYINRSVMIMEPMAGATAENREREERGKFRAGLKSGRASGSQGMKRKREDDEEGEDKLQSRSRNGEEGTGDGATKRKKTHGRGPKGPNPLAVKKPKKRIDGKEIKESPKAVSDVMGGSYVEGPLTDGTSETGVKRKRRRKHKSGAEEGTGQENIGAS